MLVACLVPPFSRSHVYCVTRANLKAHKQKNGVFSYKPPAYMLAVRILPRYKQSINTNIKSIIFQCRFFPSFSLWYFFVRTLSPSLSHAVPLQRSYGFLHCSFISFNHIHTQSACVLCRVRWWPVGMLHAIHPFSMYRWVFHDGLASFQWKKSLFKVERRREQYNERTTPNKADDDKNHENCHMKIVWTWATILNNI